MSEKLNKNEIQEELNFAREMRDEWEEKLEEAKKRMPLEFYEKCYADWCKEFERLETALKSE